MKPIRSNELEFFKDMIREKFYDKKETLRTYITSEAQKLSDKKQPLWLSNVALKLNSRN